MPPVKPPVLPTLGSALARPPAKQAPPQPASFEPGLKAPKANPRLADITTDAKPAAGNAPKPAGAQLFTMQALSAYAGTLVEAADASSKAAGSEVREAKVRMPHEARPVRPGTNLDLKI